MNDCEVKGNFHIIGMLRNDPKYTGVMLFMSVGVGECIYLFLHSLVRDPRALVFDDNRIGAVVKVYVRLVSVGDLRFDLVNLRLA